MANTHHPIPSFILIGAQKAGTTWLWNNLKQHPELALPKAKEIHFFGGSEMFRKGTDWYYQHFDGLDPSKMTGEASTTYLYDYVPYWESPSGELRHDDSLPCIPELVTKELPDVKILAILRNPVSRALSAYRHYTKSGKIPLGFGPMEVALKIPMFRILELGFYAKYLKLWKQYVPPHRMRIFVFEDDVVKTPEKSIRQICEFLEIDPNFQPRKVEGRVHEGWSWTRCAINQQTVPLARSIASGRVGKIFDRYDFLKNGKAMREHMSFFQDKYREEKKELENILGKNLDSWKY